MTTITESDVTQAIQYLEGMIGGNVIDIPDVKRAVAVLSTAARFAVEASQRLDTLQAELAACRAMCQRVATEAGEPCEHKTGIELWTDGRVTLTRCEWDCQRLLVSVTTPEGYSRTVAEVVTEASDENL